MWSCSSEKFCCGVCWLGHSCGAQSMGCVGVPGVVCPDCFCFVSSSLFFESYGIMRLLFVFVTESLILAQDERWRRA